MGPHIGIVVNWYGPYKGIQEARTAAKNDYEDGLYLFIGRKKHQKSPPKPLYVGLSGYLLYRLTTQHEKLPYIAGEPLVWLGEIASHGIPGRPSQNLLHLAEWATAYFLSLPLNEKKTYTPPNHSITLVNRWWKKDYESPRLQRPHPDWPDVIDFMGMEYGARVSWIGYSDRWGKDDLKASS
jgi:hypothetical protein